jgi:large subunit ribosomal protein L6
MSRIGKQPVALPDKVKAVQEGAKIAIEGPLGRLEHVLAEGITCEKDDAKRQLVLRRASDTKPQRMLHGLERSLIRNMVLGVTQGYKKDLEVVGIGYTVKLEGKVLNLELGFANTVKVEVPAGIKVEVTQPTNPGRMTISGADKRLVGEFCAEIRAIRPPEPYQGKGIKYSNEVVRRKAGKAFVGAGA